MEQSTTGPLDRISDLIGINLYGCGQDWDLTCADPERVEEFCDIYECESLSDFDKRELMRLIVASYDDAICIGMPSEQIWQRVRRLLEAEFTIHEEIVEYWSLPKESDSNNVFPITLLMREIWSRFNKSEI
jgi:hypothetical protein